MTEKYVYISKEKSYGKRHTSLAIYVEKKNEYEKHFII